MGNILDKVRLAISRMISPGDKVLVAVSGGPDSVCLLYLLKEMQEEFRFDLSIAHMDHMARGEESAEDARFADELGKKLGLETFIARVDVRKENEILKTSFQEAGRILRYRFLESTLERIQGTKLALGHTADDQVETFLINLLRGSGLKGLAGMPETRGAVIRPLIDCTRAEIEAYLAGRNLDYRVDTSNAGNQYLRNRIRHELLPVLKTFNQNIASNLQETAKIIRDDDQCLTDQTRLLYREMVVPLANEDGGVELDRVKFNQQPPAYQKRLLRQAICQIQGNLRRITAKHIQKIIELFDDSRVGKKINLPGQLMAVGGREGVELRKSPESRSRARLSFKTRLNTTELVIPGATRIGDIGLNLHAKLLTSNNWKEPGNRPDQAFLDFDKTGPDIHARFFRPGDRFVPLGMTGRKKLKSFFIDEKIPRKQRESIPILTTRTGDIIWIYGKRISENFRVTEKTRKILFIEGEGGGQMAAGE
ncbi:MAG: tRNA lysidine(34) synthetase TilS [Nitrospinae bacterium]|nr:tRNA lysidine(34) synthetase TilS [Nitrospinota bacterium]